MFGLFCLRYRILDIDEHQRDRLATVKDGEPDMTLAMKPLKTSDLHRMTTSAVQSSDESSSDIVSNPELQVEGMLL